ncbi:MAG: IclR family transcriptional regulator [Rhodobacteraceae bacterium]|nr:IclR family transcriptional regulator [Paracoccaceae bacterium]
MLNSFLLVTPSGSVFEPSVAKKLAQIIFACQTKIRLSTATIRSGHLSTVDNALEILNLFSEERPSIGLSEVARLISRDKASTLRYLNSLETMGYIEQDPFTRSYHLGPTLARLALIREITYPVNRAARSILKKLVADTGETAHLSHFSGESLSNIAIEETSYRGTRVFIDPAEPMTLHATASGLSYLSQCPKDRLAALLGLKREAHTPDTPMTKQQLDALIATARQRGYAESIGTFEVDICGIAAPVFGPSGEVCGAVAVAAPVSRMTEPIRRRIAPYVIEASRQISKHYGAKRLPEQETSQ